LTQEHPQRGVSRRAVCIGLLCCMAISLGEAYGVLVVRGSAMAADYSTGAALFLFFLITLLINPLAQVLTGSRLRGNELATVYIMMIVSSAIPSWGFVMNLIPFLGGLFYYATPENDWANIIHPHVPNSLVAQSRSAIWKLFEGATSGEPVPWELWYKPLMTWFFFIVSIYFSTLCILVVLRKQWMENERLLFPLATLPLEMSQQEKDKLLPPLFRNYLTWAGFALPFIIHGINGLHSYFGFIPSIQLNTYFRVLRNAIGFSLLPRFEVIGLSYLLSLDVSFGVWFFAFLATMHTGIERMLGWSIGPGQPYSLPASPSVAHLAQGAMFFLVFSSLWAARHHVADVVRKAFGKGKDIDDSDELVSYRTAVFGFLAASVFAVFWLVDNGLGPGSAIFYYLLCIVTFVGLARIVSQAGLAYGVSPVAPPVFIVTALGPSALGASGLTALGMNFPWSADLRTFVMASAATGLKIAEVTRLEGRRLFMAILAAILVTLLSATWAVMTLAYKYGGINLGGWGFGGLTQLTGDWVAYNINNAEDVYGWHLAYTGIGSLAMALLTYIKTRFIGFPIHPIGLALGLTYPISNIWFSVFIAWLFKAIILKYGGAKGYRLLRPFFLGMVLGAFGAAGLWLIIDAFGGMSNWFTM
jgi:hypothetical protein